MADDASSTPSRLTDEILDEVAEAAAADERAVLCRLVGFPVRGRRAQVIDRELDARGLLPRSA
ncbi:MAG: hypothetical protein KF764_16940 [Labilithrix sp.]|nr:hypothetical protein [Labilithrix sp.]